jgi:hypothetical protein
MLSIWQINKGTCLLVDIVLRVDAQVVRAGGRSARQAEARQRRYGRP